MHPYASTLGSTLPALLTFLLAFRHPRSSLHTSLLPILQLNKVNLIQGSNMLFVKINHIRTRRLDSQKILSNLHFFEI